MTPSEPRPSPLGDPAQRTTLVDYVRSLDCIHCGLCLQTCPTYRLTGQESSSPRGRIHLMRAVAEDRLVADDAFAEEMDFCLLCRHCESVCPAGVEFGAMMEFTRDALQRERPPGLAARLVRALGLRLVLPHRWVLRRLGSALRLAQTVGLDRLADRLADRGWRHLPRIPSMAARRLLPRRSPARGARPGRALVLEGCVMPEFHAHVNRATVRSLTGLGLEVEVVDGTCCGSLHAHNGDVEGARRLVATLVVGWEKASDAAGKPLDLVVNSAGCGAHLKELANLFPEGDAFRARALALARSVRDYSEFVAPRLDPAKLRTPDLPGPITWDDPCHLCHAQKIRAEPRGILAAIPGLQTVPLEDSESCCGSAGLYALLRPADSRAVFDSRRAALARSGARTLVSANPGCLMQWESGLSRAGSPVRVVHLAEVVDAALVAAETL